MSKQLNHPEVDEFKINVWEMGYYGIEAVRQHGIFGFIAWTFGTVAATIFREQDVADVVRRFGNLDLVATYADESEEDGRAYVYRRGITVEAVANRLTEEMEYKPGNLASIMTLQQLAGAYEEHIATGGGHLCSLLTEKEQEAVEAEDRRHELESAAKAFAHTSGKLVGTYDFIRAVEAALARTADERESWNSHERRMEEFAAHSYAGGGSQTYFDDHNYVNSELSHQRDELEGILHWLRSECPLLMAKYEEMKLSGEWATEEAEAS